MLILFIGDGRLGNQVFQYAALSSLAGKESRILAVGLEDLERAFELNGPRCKVLPGGIWMKRLMKYLVKPLLLLPLSRWLRVFSYAHELDITGEHSGSSGELEVLRGWLSGLMFVDGGYYQNSEFWPRLFPPATLRLRERWREGARRALACHGVAAGSRPIFLHVRRADYLGFTSFGLSDLLLPTEYFRAGIERVRARIGHHPLVIVTDDRDWVEREFQDVTDRVVISSSPLVDFAVMAECAGGIISNSTFSLAASFFMHDPKIVLGPEYWFGFRVRRWLPPRIRFTHECIEYLSI